MAFRDKLARFKARHASKVASARGMMGRAKPILIAGAAGGAAQYAGEMLGDHLEFVRTHWYGEPVALAGAAYLMQRKNQRISDALAGAAGYSLAQRKKMKDGKFQVPNFTASSSAGTTSGIDDTGSLQNPNEF